MNKILISGGHLTPAIALIQSLPKDVKVVYLGRKFSSSKTQAMSPERQEVESYGAEFIEVDPPKFERHRLLVSFFRLLDAPLFLVKIINIIRRKNIDRVMSFGGYIGIYAIVAGWCLRKITIIHEQTVGLGLANRLSIPFATNICYAFKSTGSLVPLGKSVWIGSPLRQMITNESAKVPAFINSKKDVIFITGGNQGSQVINKVVSSLLPWLAGKFQVIHQTGNANAAYSLSHFEKLKQENNLSDYMPRGWFTESEMSWLLHNAKIVISRGGANTIAEILFAKTPAIIIPLPYAQNDEQTKNAKLISDEKAGILIPQAQLSTTTLKDGVFKVLDQHKSFKLAAKQNPNQLQVNAAKELAKILLQ